MQIQGRTQHPVNLCWLRQLLRIGRVRTNELSGKGQPQTRLKPSKVRESRFQGRLRMDADSIREGS
jgi:hypothetical protein